jgi:hypothetical protein
MIGLQSNKVIKQKERGWQMSANVYTIENLLVGNWYGENTEAYVVQIDTPSYLSDRYATVAVKIGE